MATTQSQITVVPTAVNGVTAAVAVTITDSAGATVTAYTTKDGSTAHVFPVTITSSTLFCPTVSGALTISAVAASGEQVAAPGGATRTINTDPYGPSSGMKVRLEPPADAGAPVDYPTIGVGRRTAPTAAFAQTLERDAPITNVAPLTSQKQYFAQVKLHRGETVTSVSWLSATQAAVDPTNQWASLYSPALAKLAVSADAGTVAWAANALKTFTLASPYLVPTTGNYYLGLMVKAGTVPSLGGLTSTAALNTIPPIMSGYDNTNDALEAPATAPATAAALTVSTTTGYGYVS